MKFLTSGKVKDVYEIDTHNLLFKFSDRVSAYDVKFKDEIPQKGKVLCKFAEFWFENLDVQHVHTRAVIKKNVVAHVIRNHFIEQIRYYLTSWMF